ncbi:hypothetical protein BGZ47_007193 [Haplosporangium gracile]|nr:hypothetical protein BGZ47_007193 [Haplosporangium gracile]
MHIPNPAFSLPSFDRNNGTESLTNVTDLPSSLNSHVLGQDFACLKYVPNTAGQKYSRDSWGELDEAPSKTHRSTHTLAHIRQKLVSNKDYERPGILIEMTKNPPKDSIDHKLWGFLVGAGLKFPAKDTTKLYSESTGLSSYVLPLCQAIMGDPEKMVFLNFEHKITVSGKCRAGTKSKREPDLVLKLKNKTNRTVCELEIDEGTSHAHKNYKKKNARDLAPQTMSIYLMRRCGSMYVMIYVHNVFISDSMRDLTTIGVEYKIWSELALTVKNGIKPVLNVETKEKAAAVHPPLGAGNARLHTVPTPELNKLLKRV